LVRSCLLSAHHLSENEPDNSPHFLLFLPSAPFSSFFIYLPSPPPFNHVVGPLVQIGSPFLRPSLRECSRKSSRTFLLREISPRLPLWMIQFSLRFSFLEADTAAIPRVFSFFLTRSITSGLPFSPWSDQRCKYLPRQ